MNDDSKLPSAPSPAEETACPNTGEAHAYGIHDSSGEWQCASCGQLRPLPALPEPVSTEGAAEMLPCPFCGSKGKVHEGDEIFWTECHTCSLDLAYQGTREAAIAAWNQRTPVAKPSAEGDGWIAEPNEQGWWWHINVGEQADMIPFVYYIMRSGTNGKMFVQFPDCRWCSDVGGLWAKTAPPPALPAPPSGQGEKR